MRAEGRGTTRSSRAAGGWLQSGSQCHLQALQGKSGLQCHLQALQGKSGSQCHLQALQGKSGLYCHLQALQGKKRKISSPGDREGCGRGADL